MVYRCILLRCIEQKVSLAIFLGTMEQNKSIQLLELLKPVYGEVQEISKTISDAMLEIAVTPLADPSDSVAIQRAISVMWEFKKALDLVGSLD